MAVLFLVRWRARTRTRPTSRGIFAVRILLVALDGFTGQTVPIGTAREHDPALEDYLDDQVRQLLGIPRGEHVQLPRPPARLIERLLRIEEYSAAPRDALGRYEFDQTESYRTGRLWTPELDAWAAEQRGRLSGKVKLQPLWPAGHRFAMCSTHDVDMVSRQVTVTQAWRAVRAAAAPARPGLSSGSATRRVASVLGRFAYYGVSRTPSTSASLERSLEVEQRLGISGTYLFTVLPRNATYHDCVYDGTDPCRFHGRKTTVGAVVREVRDQGMDVGLHGSITSALDPEILAQEREALELQLGASVVSTRQHYLRFDVHRTPRVQTQSGLRVDSTIGFNRHVGFRAGTSLPYRHFDLESRQKLSLLEVPLIIQDTPLLARHALALGRQGTRQLVAKIIDAVAEAGGVMTLLFHPHHLLNADLREMYTFSLEYGLDQGAWGASLAQIESWWSERERRLQSSVDG